MGTLPVTGGCLCGAIRYESTNPPNWIGICHCRMCQRASGGLFGPFGSFSRAGFRITGEPTYYQSSKAAERGFCRTCGSPLFMRYTGSENLGVLVGTFDRPDDWPMTFCHTGIESKISWYAIPDEFPRYKTGEDPVTAKYKNLLPSA